MSKLDEWAALADAATEGPWVVEFAIDERLAVCLPGPMGGESHGAFLTADATFIAASRTAVPALIEALRAIETLCQVADYNDGLISTEYIRTIRDAALGENNV